jgi:hypothetical protein
MKFFSVLVVCLAVVLGVSGIAQAEPINLKQVPADAKWLAHIDVDAVRNSTVYQHIRAKCLEMHKDAAKQLDMARTIVGMDPRTDLHGITLYGKDLGKHTGVLIIHAKVDPAPLLRMAPLAPDHKIVKYGAYELHTWTVKCHGHSQPGAGAYHKSEGIVIASCIEELKAALDLLDGNGTCVSSDSPLAGSVAAGTTVMARVAGIADAKLPCKCPLAQQTAAIRFSTGEHDGQSFFRARATMANAEVVGQLKTVVDGGRALAQLGAKEEVDKRLINGLKITPAEKTLTILWSGSANDVWEVIQREAKKIATHREKMKQMGWSHRPQPGEKKGGDHKDTSPDPEI